MEKFCMFPSFFTENSKKKVCEEGEEALTLSGDNEQKTPYIAQKEGEMGVNKQLQSQREENNNSPDAMLKILSKHTTASERIRAGRKT